MKKFFITLFFVMFSANAFAADVTIKMLNKTKKLKKEWFTAKSL